MEKPVEIVYQDESLLGINKSAGLLTIRDGYDASLPYLTRLLEVDFGRLWVVHRLDRDTSGILLLARNSESHRILNTAFENRQVKKLYHTVVVGVPDWSEALAEMPILVNGDRRHRSVISQASGKPARTELRVLQKGPDHTLIEAHPTSGYTHQIRVHLAGLGFPILSDALYLKKSKSNPNSDCTAQTEAPISRLALHAFSIQFIHPVTSLEMNLSAPYPEDFRLAILKLFQNDQHCV